MEELRRDNEQLRQLGKGWYEFSVEQKDQDREWGDKSLLLSSAAIRERIEGMREDIVVFAEKINASLVKGEIMEGFKSLQEMQRCINYSLIEERILTKSLSLLPVENKNNEDE